MTATTWRGRRGAMLLGPTEDRVARYLADRTSNGRVTIRTTDLIAALGIERSEAYRVTARLRVLGLFGIENDRGGTNGGRRYWRTPTEHDGARLDGKRHRIAWSRILSWSRARRDRAIARLEAIRHHTSRVGIGAGTSEPARRDAPAAEIPPSAAGGPSFGAMLRRTGLIDNLLDEWGV